MAVGSADEVDIARALRDHESGVGASLLDGDVDRDRRAMNEVVSVPRRNAGLRQAVPDALRQLMRRREGLRLDDAARGFVVGDEVGKGAANVGGDAQTPS